MNYTILKVILKLVSILCMSINHNSVLTNKPYLYKLRKYKITKVKLIFNVISVQIIIYFI